MDWNDYRLVLAVVREKTIRGAARSLGVNHATISRRLSHLNRGTSGPLVQKSPQGFWPTRAGEAIVEAAEKMELNSQEALRKLRAVEQNLSGPLSISFPVLVLQHFLFDDVANFAEQYPDIDLTIDSTDNLVDLDRAEADIVLRTSANPPEHWVGRRLFRYAVSLYAHRDYLAQTRTDDLTWIGAPEGATRWWLWLKETPYRNNPVGPTVAGISGRFGALKQHFGIGWAACFMADPDPDLVRLPDAPVMKADPFWLLTHPDFAKTSRARVAMKYFAEVMQSHRALIQGDLS
ncbi:LysR family transcriptional regulator [Aurantiacibacter sp. D1-12]|uniref:LysR family transcriptional regulator n=1 Tax=Aurantiacibacter sp. D1-12 TaxID=2993658 RepID=UPI00237D26EA|nr:LysR family transcriptional regulator [Aurantiacibacter sp. D1-12]MDE1467744.1 LysR family transcriptional regulator [Aurantiacibacter sp. D1-12]